LQSAFDRFTLWGVYVRGAFFALSFLCTVWALTRVSRDLARPHRPIPGVRSTNTWVASRYARGKILLLPIELIPKRIHR
jgi:hypothetical protein